MPVVLEDIRFLARKYLFFCLSRHNIYNTLSLTHDTSSLQNYEY